MQKKEHLFNEMVRRVRKELFGKKSPHDVRTVFVDNMAITMMRGNLTPVEKFLTQTEQGVHMVHQARTS